MNSPAVNMTVAICTWNRCESLRQTLDHMARLRVPDGVTWELLVVNNNCTDGTDDVCAAFRDRLPIRVLHEPRPGQSFARNLAVAEARGEFLAWTDDDVLVDPAWLSGLLAAFRDFGASWAFGSSEPEWPSTAPSWYEPRFRGNFAVLDYGEAPFVVQGDQPFFGLNFAGLLSAHVELGGFNTEYGFKGKGGGVGEDVDLFERAFRAGMKIVYTPGARVRHVIEPERIHKAYHRRRQWVSLPKYYGHMRIVFGNARWLGGLPRFFYADALKDLLGFAAAALTFDQSLRFYHELRLMRFAGLLREAWRQRS